ncbi:LysR family transcriptional regulator [Pectobacterium carotovorum]|uniref:LysR family transcriptional regulator n=1 Tax=Pectobacterium carotovorum TaxID=554 RepID=UPI0015DE6EED|nr:LysR substrate-binding domain-containing protein [Pectobacterium carotovorum]MBA0177243.1 LysR family transcriptional regulator [Pectobacterium carotovorum]
MDKLRAMQAFIYVAETGSFSAAALKLNLPKARISQRINDLESELGIRLFERTTRAVKITHAGQEYFEECAALLRNIERVEQNLKLEQHSFSGRITVDVLSPVARWIILPHLHDFNSQYPEIQISLKSNDSIAKIHQESIDLAIRGGSLEDSSLIARPLCHIPFQLYASPELASSLSQSLCPSSLQDEKLISWMANDEKELVWHLQKAKEHIVVRNGKHQFISDQDLALAYCALGHGVCPGMYLAADAYVKKGMLTPVFNAWSLAEKNVTILYPSKKHLPKRVECFISWLVKIVEQYDFDARH